MDPDERHEDFDDGLIVTVAWECGNCGAALLVLSGEEPSEPCQSCGAEAWVGEDLGRDDVLERLWRQETGSRDPQGPPPSWRPRRR